MYSFKRYFFAFICMLTVLCAEADGVKSFSKQMNELKRSGNYVYAEASAPNEADAKAACDALLKIEITKYINSKDSQSDANARIVKDISDYSREYLVQPRGEMIRVFGYVAKKDVSSKNKKKSKDSQRVKKDKEETAVAADSNETSKEETEKASETPKEENVNVAVTDSSEVQKEQPVQEIVSPETKSEEVAADVKNAVMPVESLHTDGVQLAKWQTEMLESVVKEPDMMQAKRLLNRYKNQNRVKRLGDRSITNPRTADSFYLICNGAGQPIALLAPSATSDHYDMMSGTTVNIDTYSGNQFLWFQISK